jgi:protein gp37
MSGDSAIEWTDATWNPSTGCDRISPGCDNCYALDLAARLKRMGQPAYQRDGDPRTSGPGFGLTLHPDRLKQPNRWRKPRMIFVNSMSDLFHKDVPVDFLDAVWDTMATTPQHTYQILTKRPKRMSRTVAALSEHIVLPNVWLGTSIESRDYASRADHLRQAPAAVRFISAEPLLGPLVEHAPGTRPDYTLNLDGIDWLIAGGESGPNARPMDPQWVRDLRDACVESGTAFFFKQWGGRTPKAGGRTLDGRTWDEMPVIA